MLNHHPAPNEVLMIARTTDSKERLKDVLSFMKDHMNMFSNAEYEEINNRLNNITEFHNEQLISNDMVTKFLDSYPNLKKSLNYSTIPNELFGTILVGNGFYNAARFWRQYKN